MSNELWYSRNNVRRNELKFDKIEDYIQKCLRTSTRIIGIHLTIVNTSTRIIGIHLTIVKFFTHDKGKRGYPYGAPAPQTIMIQDSMQNSLFEFIYYSFKIR
ncbi:hypothetical protein AVEN_239081-1 [Araneus ventricosus]|uniref:Uncharacterized protein n=1 Tax=Araneus ventricosus TaxID=182803 RepID=A0A4Y2FPF3_ARAVE|nr:hypothetical protein AVEN_239081-1 [Araneus ventricosus]